MSQTAYVINLDIRPDRWRKMCELWSPYLSLERVSGIMLPEDGRPHNHVAADGLGQTHMKLYREAIARGDKTILIMEDDAVPQPGWHKRWLEHKEWLDNNLDQWDVYNGGAHQLKKCYGVKEFTDSVILDSQLGSASHFMYLNLQAIDRLLNWENHKMDIDMWFCSTGFKLYCAYPILAKQANGHSNIINVIRDFDREYMVNEAHFRKHLGDLYYKYCVKV
jgi:GR25 family glycosyltransferase involved in LPS biosynthesis